MTQLFVKFTIPILFYFYRFSLDYQQDDWSPRSARSGSSTPPSTPPMKLFEDMENSDDEHGEENYSPVCSDNEWAEDGLTLIYISLITMYKIL